jgi:hypothetical protein
MQRVAPCLRPAQEHESVAVDSIVNTEGYGPGVLTGTAETNAQRVRLAILANHCDVNKPLSATKATWQLCNNVSSRVQESHDALRTGVYCYNSACQSWATHGPGTVMQENPVETTKQHYSGNFSTHFYCTHIKQSIMVRYQGCATEHSIRYVQLLLRKTAVCDCRYFQHIKARGASRLPHVIKAHTIKCDLKVRDANAQSRRAGSNDANEQTATGTEWAT